MRLLNVMMIATLLGTAAIHAEETYRDLCVDGQPWLRTMITPFDSTSPAAQELTYKVYTHILDFKGNNPITKGPGGKYTHHRGLFIGWKDTLVNGADYDTWHMSNCSQRFVSWIESPSDAAIHRMNVDWCDPDGRAFIKEIRTIRARQGENHLRVIDFESELTAVANNIQLKGDLQHAGMQVRMADEVNGHQDSTQYILPEGAKEHTNDRVTGAWWVCASVVIEGKRYWAMHMTAPDLVGGIPVYSIRRYARFGAFFEPELKPGKPLAMKFRIAISDTALDQATCQAIYAAFAAEGKK